MNKELTFTISEVMGFQFQVKACHLAIICYQLWLFVDWFRYEVVFEIAVLQYVFLGLEDTGGVLLTWNCNLFIVAYLASP